MTLSIDTNVFIDMLRGSRSNVRHSFEAAASADEPLATSLIVLQELVYGAALHPEPEKRRTAIYRLTAPAPVAPFDENDMIVVAELRARLRRQGSPIGAYDALIAGQALARGWTVVTANIGEFARIDGLNVIDWTVA